MSEETSLVVQRRKTFEQQLAKMAPRLGELLPARAGDPKRFVRMVGTAVLRNPDLLAPDVDRASLVMALLTLAEMGLGPGPLAHLVAFRGKGGKKYVTPIPGFMGYVDVAIATGKVASFDAGPVYANDRFRWVRGSNPVFEHEPLLGGDGDAIRGAYTGSFALAWPVSGVHPWVIFVPRHDIEVIRNGSKGYQYALANGVDNPWLDGKKPGEFRPGSPSAAMGTKTAIRQLWKLLPKSPEMILVEAADQRGDEMSPPAPDDSITELLGLERVDEAPEMKEERTRMLKALVAAQQREPARFAKAAVSLGIEPKVKLETMSTDGLSALEDALAAEEAK